MKSQWQEWVEECEANAERCRIQDRPWHTERCRIESQILEPLRADSDLADRLDWRRSGVVALPHALMLSERHGGWAVARCGTAIRSHNDTCTCFKGLHLSQHQHRIKLVLKTRKSVQNLKREDPRYISESLDLINESMQGVPKMMQGIEVMLFKDTDSSPIQRPLSREEIEVAEACQKRHEAALERRRQQHTEAERREVWTKRKDDVFEALSGIHPDHLLVAPSQPFYSDHVVKQGCKTVFLRAAANPDSALGPGQVIELTTQLCQQLDLSSPAEENINKMFAAFDKSKDGLLQFDEFVGFYKALLRNTFKKFEENRSGNATLTLQSSLQHGHMTFLKLSGAEVCRFPVASDERLSCILERLGREVDESSNAYLYKIDVVLPGGQLLRQALSENPFATLSGRSEWWLQSD